MPDVELPNPDDIEDLKKDGFSKMVALSVAAYAVVLAVASLGGNNAAKETNLNQQQASNQWAYYQAKVIRETNARLLRLRLELDLEAMPPERRAAAEKLRDFYAGEEQRYGGDKDTIRQEAEKFQADRDLNLAKDPYFDYAEVLLQIAIVLASVALLANSRPAYLASVGVAVLGALLTLNGFTLLVKLPLLGS